MKDIFFVFGIISVLLCSCQRTTQQVNTDYLNTELSFEERALNLVSQMTLDEKISQMIHLAEPIERFNIPYYIWMNECLHGVANR
jgi:beta-glucosidase